MTESTWDDYVTTEDVQAVADGAPTLDPLAGTAADTLADASLGTDAVDNIYDAGQAGDWADWNSATGDDAVASAQSYFDAAATAGDPELAQQWIDDGNAQLDVADSSYSTASDYADTAAAGLGAAGEDLRLLGDDAATAAADTTSYDTGYDTAAADTTSYDTGYDTAAADTTSYDTGYDDSATS